jgi:outer membrane protein assembly factor BamB
VQGKWLIVEVGAKQGNLVAFDKLTGKQVWASQATSPAGHNAGPMPIMVERIPCIAVHNHDGLLVVRLDHGHEGQTVATYPWVTSFANNIASVAVHGDSVLLTSEYNQNKIERLRVTLTGAVKVWQQEEASKVCTPVIHDGYVYWAWQHLVCLDFETGRVQWRGGRCGDAGSCIVTSDGRLIVWANNGDLTLVDTARHSTDRYTELASRKHLGKSDAWPHLVLADRRLYCKDRSGQIVCLDLSP